MNLVPPYTSDFNETEEIPPHIDQAPKTEPNFAGYQGLLNILGSKKSEGGTIFLSGSHKYFGDYSQFSKDHIDFGERGHFRFKGEFLENMKKKMVLPELEAGDFLIWDSRTVHGVATPNQNNITKLNKLNTPQFGRSVVYILMYPRAKVTKKNLNTRRKWFLKGIPSNHSPTNPSEKKFHYSPCFPREIPYAEQKYNIPDLYEPTNYRLTGMDIPFVPNLKDLNKLTILELHTILNTLDVTSSNISGSGFDGKILKYDLIKTLMKIKY